MGRRAYTAEEKAAALELLADPSKTFYEVRDETDVPVGTLHGWAVEAGLKRSDNQTKAATEAHKARIDLAREHLRELLIRAAVEHTERALSQDKPSGVQALQTAAAIAHDKFRLEMGEHTAHTRTESPEAAEVAKTKVDELAERRKTA
jgi:transposase-like protein